MAAERCSDCDLNWPVGTKKCGVCLTTDLSSFTQAEAMTLDQAKYKEKEATFTREYNRREKGLSSKCGQPRGKPVAYLFKDSERTVDPRRDMRNRDCRTPEDLGALEAREEIPKLKEIHTLERVWRSDPATK